MKKILTFTIALLMYMSQSFGQTNTILADKITGQYWSPKKNAKMQVYAKGEKYFGKFIWLASPRKDTKNPNETLRKRELVGVEFLTNFSYDDDAYTGGKIYDPESGKTYDSKMSLNGDNLKVRGYIGISLFGRTEIFERVK